MFTTQNHFSFHHIYLIPFTLIYHPPLVSTLLTYKLHGISCIGKKSWGPSPPSAPPHLPITKMWGKTSFQARADLCPQSSMEQAMSQSGTSPRSYIFTRELNYPGCPLILLSFAHFVTKTNEFLKPLLSYPIRSVQGGPGSGSECHKGAPCFCGVFIHSECWERDKPGASST